jgi:hypothetical protein
VALLLVYFVVSTIKFTTTKQRTYIDCDIKVVN